MARVLTAVRSGYHEQAIHQTIQLNKQLNEQAQAAVDALEPRESIWFDGEDTPLDFTHVAIDAAPEDKKAKSPEDDELEQAIAASLADLGFKDAGDGGAQNGHAAPDEKRSEKNGFPDEKRSSLAPSASDATAPLTASTSTRTSLTTKKPSKLAAIFGGAKAKAAAAKHKGRDLAEAILREEAGRWPDRQWRQIVAAYQLHMGMAKKIAQLRRHQPLQYLHLLRAGYFEPIPVAWADQASNPLKFSIEPAGGWRGITPQWRGYEDTAEERLYVRNFLRSAWTAFDVACSGS